MTSAQALDHPVRRAAHPRGRGVRGVLRDLGQRRRGAPWLFTPVLVLVPLTLLWRRVAPIGALCRLHRGDRPEHRAVRHLHALRARVPDRVLPALRRRRPARMARRDAGVAPRARQGACLTLGWDASAPLDEAGVYICVLLTGVWIIARLVHMRGRNVERLRGADRRAARRARRARAAGGRRPTARGCRPSSTSCCSAASASWPRWPSAGAAQRPTRPRRRSSTSSTRAAARWRRCGRWSACCASADGPTPSRRSRR